MTTSASTLQELVAPLTEAEFLSLLDKRELKFVRGADRSRFAGLLGWDVLLSLIEQGQYPRGVGDIRLAKESINVPLERWLTRHKPDNTIRVDVARLEEFLGQGYSLIITPIDRYVPALGELCASIKSRLSEQIKVGVIVTACGSGGAFKIHFDPEDLIILQVEGSKRWQIFGPPVPNPVIGMPKQEPPPEDNAIFDEILRPGDFLFLPAGTWHHCQNGPGRSLHLGIFFIPPTSWHAVKDLTSELVSDEAFRTPLTRLSAKAELETIEAEVKRTLIEKINGLNLKDFLGQWNSKANA